MDKKNNFKKMSDAPFIPVEIFKNYELYSVKKKNILKTLSSSGTTTSIKSKIFLDKNNSINQTRVLQKILFETFGQNKLPMLVLESKNILKNKKNFSAKVAGILGFSMISSNIFFALNSNNELNIDSIKKFLNIYKNKKKLIFGFTSTLWENFFLKLNYNKIKLNFSDCTLIHGGGWKKLTNLNVSNNKFKNMFRKFYKLKNIINYYGMIEQTGSIFIECKSGYFHTSVFSDIFIRDEKFVLKKNNEAGLIQLTSLLPVSYPGHNILTQDIGKIYGEDDCSCGNKGKYFKVFGRVKESEERGCSDAYV